MSREASPRAGERFMSGNVDDADAPRKPLRSIKRGRLVTPAVTFP
jgi:hypothetical protein